MGKLAAERGQHLFAIVQRGGGLLSDARPDGSHFGDVLRPDACPTFFGPLLAEGQHGVLVLDCAADKH
ncbi:hypothetical protein ACDZ94_21865 [Pseudomonas sp. UBT]|uniref:hypothetical protein n=1 Tax=Pseudomonas sp. UBT TaxID=3239198 RepID=UPI003D800A24